MVGAGVVVCVLVWALLVWAVCHPQLEECCPSKVPLPRDTGVEGEYIASGWREACPGPPPTSLSSRGGIQRRDGGIPAQVQPLRLRARVISRVARAYPSGVEPCWCRVGC